MRIPTQVTRKQGRWLDVVLYAGAAVLCAPIALAALVPVMLTLATLWPLLIFPIIAFQRAFPRGEEAMEEQMDRVVESVRPKRLVEAHGH